jgi:hypothetical protein
MSFTLVAPSTTAIAMATSRDFPARQCGSQGNGPPDLVGQLAQLHRPGVPDQALGLASYLQTVIPPRIPHDEGRSFAQRMWNSNAPRQAARSGHFVNLTKNYWHPKDRIDIISWPSDGTA